MKEETKILKQDIIRLGKERYDILRDHVCPCPGGFGLFRRHNDCDTLYVVFRDGCFMWIEEADEEETPPDSDFIKFDELIEYMEVNGLIESNKDSVPEKESDIDSDDLGVLISIILLNDNNLYNNHYQTEFKILEFSQVKRIVRILSDHTGDNYLWSIRIYVESNGLFSCSVYREIGTTEQLVFGVERVVGI